MTVKKIYTFIVLTLLVLADTPAYSGSNLDTAREFEKKTHANYEKTIKSYFSAMEEEPENDRKIRFMLGKFYYDYGKFEKAIEQLRTVYEKDKKAGSIIKLLAMSYFMTASYTEALSIFEKYKNNKDNECLYYHARSCEKLNLYNKALELYGKVSGKPYKSLSLERMDAINAKVKKITVDDIRDKKLKRVIKTAPSQESYPNAGAVILIDEYSFEVLPDSTSVTEQYFMVKILNDRGKRYGEIKLDYDCTYENVELVYARTIKPDGTIVYAGDKHIRDVSRYQNYPLYSNSRIKIISMPEVSNDAIIEYRAKWYNSKLIEGRHFSKHFGVQGREPYLYQKAGITVPAHYKVNIKDYNPGYAGINPDFTPETTESENKKQWTWEFNKMPEIINEPYMPAWCDIVAGFAVSTFNSYDEIYRWWWKVAKDKIDRTKPMKQKVKELTKGKTIEIEKAKAIYHWCAAKIRYVGVEYGDAGFEPHYASEIFDNKYGDCKDQSMLLIAMLKIAGIKAHPVLIGTRGVWALDEDFPSLTFNHCIVLAEVNNNMVFMDPTAETTGFGDLPASDQDRMVLVFFGKEGRLMKTPLFRTEHNRVHKKMNIDISDDETIEGVRQVYTYGKYDQGQRYWIKYTKPVEFKENLKSKINTITPGGELTDYSVSDAENLNNPVKLRMVFNGPEFLTKAGNDRLVPQLGGLYADFVSREKREYPLEFSFLDKIHTEIQLTIPGKLKIKYLPEEIIRETPWFDYINRYTFSGGIIKFEEILLRKKKLIPVKDYSQYKEVYEELARQTSKQAILTYKE